MPESSVLLHVHRSTISLCVLATVAGYTKPRSAMAVGQVCGGNDPQLDCGTGE